MKAPVPQNANPIAKPHSAVRETRLELPDLEDPDRGIHAVRHHAEADVVACRALAMRPRDEALEPVDRRRRRRNESRHFVGREHRQQRRRVREPQLPQRHHRARQHRQRLPPVRFRRRRASRVDHSVDVHDGLSSLGMASFPLEYPSDRPGGVGSRRCRSEQVVVSTDDVERFDRRSTSGSSKSGVSSPELPQVMLSSRRSTCPTRCWSMSPLVPQTTLSSSARGAPHDVVVTHRGGAPDHVGAVGAAAVGAPHDVVVVVAIVPQTMLSSSSAANGAPDDVVVLGGGGAPDDVVFAVDRCPRPRCRSSFSHSVPQTML